MACLSLVQPEVMAAAQLERSKDVAAQTAAIAQLVALRPTSYGVVNALRACMQDAATYCRWERHELPGTIGVPILIEQSPMRALVVVTCTHAHLFKGIEPRRQQQARMSRVR